VTVKLRTAIKVIFTRVKYSHNNFSPNINIKWCIG